MTGALGKVVNKERDEDVKEMEEKDGEETPSVSLLDTTQESESEEEGEESMKADMSSLGNESMLSPSSVSSPSAPESSPEQAKSESTMTPTVSTDVMVNSKV